MNGYDFDDTILKGNSMGRFSLFCAVRLPYLIIFVPVLIFAAFLYVLRIISRYRYLYWISLFVVLVPHVDKFVAKFWDKNMKHIKRWYLAQKRDDDLIISASPQFLAGEACKRLGVTCIGTPLSQYDGKLSGKQCYSAQKVEIYKEKLGDTPLETFYSDSLTDIPMFKLAKKGYFVNGEKVLLVYENGQELVPCKSKIQLRRYMRKQSK